MGAKPIMYVLWDPTRDDESEAVSVKDRAIKDAKAASDLGWTVISAFCRNVDGTFVSHKEERTHLESLLDSIDAVLISGEKTRFMESCLCDLLISKPLFSTNPKEPEYPARMKLVAPSQHQWGAAAEYVTVSGWACKTCRRWWGNGPSSEHMARWCCSKQTPCNECGTMCDKGYTMCRGCREVKDIERYATRKRVPWDGKSMLYSDAHDKYFSDIDDLVDELDGLPPDASPEAIAERIEDWRVLVCEPIYGRQIDFEDVFSDRLPDDHDGDAEWSKIKPEVDALNTAIENIGPVSWGPSKDALDYMATIMQEQSQAQSPCVGATEHTTRPTGCAEEVK